MKILLIAYYFPPDSSSGSFRPLFFANHLTEMGDEVTILTARQEDFLTEQPIDLDVLSRLDQRVKVVRSAVYRPKEFLLKIRDWLTDRRSIATEAHYNATALSTNNKAWAKKSKDFITDLITTPDQQAGWIFSCVRLGFSVIRRWRPDVILATGSPWSGLIAGSILKRLTRIPLVLDFRDPWVSNYFNTCRGGVIRKIDIWLERYVVRSGDLLIANTEELRQDFLKKYSSLSAKRIVTITNGFEDYLQKPTQNKNNILCLTHTGDIYPPRNPKPLLEAAKNAIENGKIDSKKIKIRFIGNFEIDDPTFHDLLVEPSLVRSIEFIARLPYEKALKAISDSDILIVYAPCLPLQIPRKLYDYLSARRPILCVASPQSAAWSLVENYSLGLNCEDNANHLERVLVEIYDNWRNGRLEPPISDHCELFRNYNLVIRLRRYLEKAII